MKRLLALISLAAFGLLSAPALGLAQSSLDSLSAIKSRLGEDGIQLIDYSLPQNEWGSLTLEWIEPLEKEGVESLAALAQDYREEFEGAEGIHELRYRISVLDATRSRASTQAGRDSLEEEIGLLEDELEDLQTTVKEELKGLFPDLEEEKSAQGAELLFAELDYYFGLGQWGDLPYGIVAALKEADELWKEEGVRNLASLAQGYLAQDQEEGLQALKEDLAELSYQNTEGETVDFGGAEIEAVTTGVLAARFEGERQLRSIMQSIVIAIRNLVGGLAVVWIVVSGVRMVFANGDEGVVSEQKRSITYAVIGLVSILLIERMISLLYGPAGIMRDGLDTGGVANAAFDAEIFGIVGFIRAIIGVAAIFMLVLSGVRAITAQGDETKITAQKKSILWVGVGLILIAVNRVVVQNIFVAPASQDDQIYSSNIANLVGLMGTILTFILGFVGLIALGLLVYGGAMMVANYGDEDQVTKAKTIVKNAVIGILVIIAAYTIVATLVSFK